MLNLASCFTPVRSFYIGLIVVTCLSGFAQDLLVLEKTGKRRWFSYQEGDLISLVTKKDALPVHDYIIRLEDSAIVVRGDFRILLDDIHLVERYYRNRKRNGALLMLAGGLLIGITSVNNALHNQPVLDPLFITIGAGLSGIGGLWFSQSLRKYKVGDRWKLKVLTGSLHR
ncbi:MAG: hypothetical protein D4R67_00495 [Bacteroidetes bacterium]|nr:MAG: hypothetical protein D4R67_00495 [Bacteroidota bacterium]